MSGLPGSGTTTASKLLAEKTDMEMHSSGEFFREMAKERDMSLEKFGELAENNIEIDKKVDDRMINTAEPGMVLEARLTGHLMNRSEKKAFKVWIEASLDTRVRRIADREGYTEDEIEELKGKVKKREASERKRYKKYYDIDINDTSFYDLVISSEDNNPEEIVEAIMEGVKDEICERECE
ncbi:MAG: (d)CMP kinase [Thermoplasmata archaeon]